MKKKKKETNIKVPRKFTLKLCDVIWSEIVKIMEGKCAICDKTQNLNAHHLISRRARRFRWDLNNGICLCPLHHQFSLDLSAHQTPWSFEYWMADNKPEQYKWWVYNRVEKEKRQEGSYMDNYLRLEKKYKSIVGRYYKLKMKETE